MTLHMVVHTEDLREQQVAVERINYFLTFCIDSGVFINEKETKQIKKYHDAGMRVITIPEEPYDQIISLILIQKLNAICEGKLTVNDMVFGSLLSDNIKFQTNVESSEDLYGEKGWWNNPYICTEDINPKSKQKVVNITNTTQWQKLNLGWKESA